jgi:subtilisin
MGRPSLEMQELTRRGRISADLEQELAVRGVAQVVVFLEPASMSGSSQAGAKSGLDDVGVLESCFVKDDRSLAAALASASLDLAARSSRRGMRASWDAPANYYSDIPIVRKFPKLGILMGDVHNTGLERLAANPRVRYVASSLPLSLIQPIAAGAVPAESDQIPWGIRKLEIPALWAAGLQGHGVGVAHLDTGVSDSHPALIGAVGGFLFTDLHGNVDLSRPIKDTAEHGTHTAGTIAGREVSGRKIGVAPGATLHSAVVSEGGNAVARFLAGMEWALSQNVRVLNMSIGVRPFNDGFLTLLSSVRAAGILPVCAAGNFGAGDSTSPGNYDLVLSVGACDSNLNVIPESSSQVFTRPRDPIVPDLVAPGFHVLSARPQGGGHQELSGTSQAAAHISGLAALLWQAKPAATVAEIESAIFNSCSLGTMSNERANRGLPNGPRAYELLMGFALPKAA